MTWWGAHEDYLFQLCPLFFRQFNGCMFTQRVFYQREAETQDSAHLLMVKKLLFRLKQLETQDVYDIFLFYESPEKSRGQAARGWLKIEKSHCNHCQLREKKESPVGESAF